MSKAYQPTQYDSRDLAWELLHTFSGLGPQLGILAWDLQLGTMAWDPSFGTHALGHTACDHYLRTPSFGLLVSIHQLETPGYHSSGQQIHINLEPYLRTTSSGSMALDCCLRTPSSRHPLCSYEDKIVNLQNQS